MLQVVVLEGVARYLNQGKPEKITKHIISSEVLICHLVSSMSERVYVGELDFAFSCGVKLIFKCASPVKPLFSR